MDGGAGGGSPGGRVPLGKRSAGPPGGRPDRLSTGFLAGLLVLGHALTGWLLLRSFLASPPDGWDQGSVTAAGVPAMWAHLLSWITEWGTSQLVRAGWLRMWWIVPPLLVMVVSLIRLLYVVQQP